MFFKKVFIFYLLIINFSLNSLPNFIDLDSLLYKLLIELKYLNNYKLIDVLLNEKTTYE